jgi:hypothetical protein
MMSREGLWAAVLISALMPPIPAAGTPGAGAEQSAVKAFDVRGCTFTMDVTLPVDPGTAFDVMTGDISGWWDHSFVENPRKLYIEPKPGGGFYEIFDDKGNGARHATIIYADRGKRLRFEGPLGLSGRAVTFVASFDFDKTDTGSVVKLTANMVGQFDDKLQSVVEDVWRHFLVDRLKPYVESGAYKKKR